MKVYLSTDMEGTAGIVDWRQCRPGPEYEHGRSLLLAEVNAAIEGAMVAGATEICVNDSHGTMQNLPPDWLAGDASYLAGSRKPRYMMEGLDETYDACLFISYHAAAGVPGVLSHTYNPRAISQITVDGTVAGESGVNALVAAAYGVPVVLVTGDQHVGPEAEPFCPRVEVVQVKRSVSRTAAESLHPRRACDLIREGAERALARLDSFAPPRIARPATMEVSWLDADLAELAAQVAGERIDAVRTRLSGEPLVVYDAFVGQVTATRSLLD